MYSNALSQNPLFKSKIAYKQGIEEYSIGTVTSPCQWDTVPKQAHRTKYSEQRKAIHATTQSTVEQHVTPKVYELDSTLSQKKFNDVDKNRASCHETTGKRIIGRTFSIPNVIQNNVVIETSKPKIIKEHVGGSSEFPTSKIGEALLKQKTLNVLANDIPECISNLNKKLAMCLSIHTKGTPTTSPSPPPSAYNPPLPSPPQTKSSPSQPHTSVTTSGYETPSEVEMEVDETATTTSTDSEARSAEEEENYKQLLAKLSRIKTRVVRNPTSDISQATMNYLRDFNIIEAEDTDRSNVVAKIDDAIAQLENHFTKLPEKRKAWSTVTYEG